MTKNMIIRNNITSELVKKHIEQEEKERRAKQTAYTPSYGQLCIYFYEWSDMNNNPLVFHTYFSFFRFCVESDIDVDEDMRHKIYAMSNTVYAVCKKGSPELIADEHYTRLKVLLDSNE